MDIATTKKTWMMLALSGVLALGGCDDPVGNDDDDHGDEIVGVALVLNGQTIASYDGESGTWTGELEVAEGEETAHIDVRFVNEDGDAVALDDDFHLDVVIEDEGIAEFEQDTPGEFGGHLHGIAAGETEAVFLLMHGAVGAGHEDFVTEPVHVHVN